MRHYHPVAVPLAETNLDIITSPTNFLCLRKGSECVPSDHSLDIYIFICNINSMSVKLKILSFSFEYCVVFFTYILFNDLFFAFNKCLCLIVFLFCICMRIYTISVPRMLVPFAFYLSCANSSVGRVGLLFFRNHFIERKGNSQSRSQITFSFNNSFNFISFVCVI